MAARDEQERARLRSLGEVMKTRIPERDMNRSERKQQKSTQRKHAIEESRRKAAADTEVATLQMRLHQLKEQQAPERDDLQHQFEKAVAQQRVAAFQEAQAISRDAERMRDEAIAGAEAAADRVKQEEERAQKERHHRAQEEQARRALDQERFDAQQEEIRILREQIAAANHPRGRSPSP
ncbi:hypothetical protein PHYSODRAFT_304299 [Phytophthora sojae]|uniref:Uncharacterized protein n=1 Tax=Phytophthora sojae (strain P6497) TaxID=1094619 RepID=G4ZZN8_PHYSP|nr:hypothetical protein PHYSODRAFT_304299 [Phytophthora sojae]EGZ10384.1 hypothetical protein PHYSODRAFT_304299 [Phytophthora sojae]|eukprot:XP_009533129.1 hypothetical protein PHYSODRAFT_304299 [Phytophthora sojae]